MTQQERDAIEALHFHVYFQGGKALRGRKLNMREEALFQATSVISDFLARTRTPVELQRELEDAPGVCAELTTWLFYRRQGEEVMR